MCRVIFWQCLVSWLAPAWARLLSHLITMVAWDRSYHSDLMLLQAFHPMAPQLSKKLCSHWLKFFATVSCQQVMSCQQVIRVGGCERVFTLVRWRQVRLSCIKWRSTFFLYFFVRPWVSPGLGPEYLVLVLVVLEYLISVLVLVLRPLGT